MENGEFNTFVSVDEEELKQAMGLEIDDEGNFYDPLSKDLDNDGIADRYDNDFKDSDYFESKHHEELVPYMCKMDFALTELKGGVLKRMGTIASGADCCDFYICKKGSKWDK